MSVFAPRRNVIVDWNVAAYSPAQASRARQHLSAQRTRLAWWRWIALLAVVVIIATLQTGCAAVPPGSAGASHGTGHVKEYNYETPAGSRAPAPGGSKADSRMAAAPSASAKPPSRAGDVAFAAPDDDAASSREGVSADARRIAEQSERDVAMLLSRGTSGGSNADASHANASQVSNTLGAPRSSVQKPSTSISSQTGQTPAVSPTQPEIKWNDAPARNADGWSAALPSSFAPVPPPATVPPATTAPAVVEPAAPTSQPDAATLRPDRIRQLTVELARELYASGAYSEHPLRELTIIAAMGMTDPERKLDPSAIPDLTEEERALLAHLQTFFASVGETLDRGSDVNAGVAQAAASLKQALVHEPQLNLPTLALCTRVGGFGDYSPFERNVFLAGADQKAIVYLEIEDFVSEINQNNEFVTETSQQLTIFSERDGIPVWHEDWQQATDVARNKRQDFFTTQIITLPKNLGVGKYTLKVRVRDDRSKAESETSIPFEFVADAKMLK